MGLEDFCGTDSIQIWEDGYLAPCFQDSVLWGLLHLCFLVAGGYRIFSLIRKPMLLYPYYWTFYVKTACHVILAIFPSLSLFGLFLQDELQPFQAVYYICSILIWIFSLLVFNLEYARGILHNWVLQLFWTAAFILYAIRMQTLVVRIRRDESELWEVFVFTIAMLSVTLLSCLSLFYNYIPDIPGHIYKRLEDEERKTIIKEHIKKTNYTLSSGGTTFGDNKTPLDQFRIESPEEKANILSRLFFTWLNPLLKAGNERVLEDEDLYDLAMKDTSQYNSDVFQKAWQEEVLKPKPSMVRALYRSFGRKFLFAGFLKLINDALQFAGPICLNRIVFFIQEGTEDAWKPYLWVVLMTVSAVTLSFISQAYFDIVYRVSMRVRAAVVTAVYSKSFKLNNQSRQGSTTGEISNHMSTDSQRLLDLIPYLHQIWSGPLQIIICLGFLAYYLQWALLAGIALMVLLFPVNGIIIKKLQGYQKGIMKNKDTRVKITNEVLQGIRVIKFFAWESSFRDSINAIRELELMDLKKSAYWGSIVMFMWMSTPLFVSIITLTTYMLIHNELSPEVAFTSLAFFNILRFPLNMLPTVIQSMVDANVSLKRVSKFLLSEESDPHSITRNPNNLPTAVKITDGTFAWSGQEEDKSNKIITLKNLNLEIKRGELAAICGPVGSGKSSILSACLGDIDRLEGRVEVNGSVAYVSQNAWIQNATLMDNILFGRVYDHERYRNAIRVCELESDLKVFPAGDQTEIGEKGINLSGGQKQRVSMARAVYADADIYLLDDPLSAVDAHVGKNIFRNCIHNYLGNKTRILVTHQLQHLPNADRIIVVADGSVTEVGTHEQLLNSDGVYANLFRTHVNQAKDEEEEDSTALVDAPEEEKKKVSKLIQQEERESGEVSKNVYKLYIVSLGGTLTLIVILALFFLEQISKVVADWWLSYWTDTDSQALPGEGRTDGFYIGIYAAIGVANAFFVLARAVSFAVASLNSAKAVHNRLLTNILRVPMSFYDTTPVGRILNRFAKDLYTVDQMLPRTISMFVVMLFSCVSILIVIGIITPFFFTAVIPLTYIYTLVQSYYMRSSREIKRLDGISRSPIFTHFDETLSGVVTIKAFSREPDFVKENEYRLDTNQRAYFIGNSSNRWLALRLELIGTAVVGFAALFCVVERDNIDPGAAGLSLTYALQTTSLLNWLVRMYTDTENQMVSVERLVEYTKLEQEAPAIQHPRPPPEWPQHGQIEFRDFKLRYRPGLELVLKGINCTIKPKEKIGVVGRTGAGKSTLMLALFRLIEAAGGHIKIDGIDISSIGLEDLRSKISIIPQDPTLFTGTFRSNLDPFNSFRDEDIHYVLKAVHLHDLVQKNGGILGRISEGGANISVGQRQLMCLARALLKHSRIIVMDEATASVDFETDSLIQQTIATEFKDCTVLIIAHRIHTIEHCDRVLVLNFGEIAEFDAPDVLKRKPDGMFASMVADSGTAKNK